MRGTARRGLVLFLGAVVAAGALVVGPGFDPVPVDPDLVTLLSLPDDQVDAYLSTHHDLVIEVLDSRPDVVATWWSGLAADEREEMISSGPKIVGNLEGVDYASRDAANRAHLDAQLDAVGKTVAANPSDATAVTQFAALTAIHGAIKGKHDPSRYLVQLTDDQPPLASVAVGDLDTARQVTFAVPGMGTYSTDMQLWTVAAENVYTAQGKAGAPAERAVVAWIGYTVPPPGIDATVGGFAALGAPHLSSDLAAVTAVREGTGLDTLSVIAHSYGTTMAADALADVDLDVYSFVMLGSAGIEYRIGNAARLHAERVYAGEADLDVEALWGRLERIDPRTPGFGATVIRVDGDPARGLLAVTGHEPILHSSYNDDPASGAWTRYADPVERDQLYQQHMRSFGYLDNGTQSLEITAQVSTRPAEPMRRPTLADHHSVEPADPGGAPVPAPVRPLAELLADAPFASN